MCNSFESWNLNLDLFLCHASLSYSLPHWFHLWLDRHDSFIESSGSQGWSIMYVQWCGRSNRCYLCCHAREAAQLQEVMPTIPSQTQEAPASLRLQLLSIVDRPPCSIWLPVLQLINLVVRTIIEYNDTQSKTHCIWRIVYSELNRADPRPHDVWPYTAQCVRCQGRSTNYYQLVLRWE